MPSSRNSPKILQKKPLAKKQWKAALSKPSATSARKNKRPALSVPETISQLKHHYPDAHCALDYETPFQLLIATILSAQCTDERVNIVTKVLFQKYPHALAMSQAQLPDLEEIVRSTGFFKNKAKNILQCSKTLVEKHNSGLSGEVPKELETLVELPGVGRKTANVVLGNAYQIASGVVVDTHVTRLSNRFRWVKTENAEKIEVILNKVVPRSDWILISHLLISHGRALCKARSPQCDLCFLADACPAKL